MKPGVILIEAFWRSTGTRFMQGFELADRPLALAKFKQLKEDAGAEVSWTNTEFTSVEALVAFMSEQKNKPEAPAPVAQNQGHLH